MQLIMSVVGMAVLILIAVLLSSNRRAINLRTVIGAFLIQVVIGAFVLYVPTGRDVLGAMSSGVANVIAYGNEGISFIFGGLVSDKMFEVFGGGGVVHGRFGLDPHCAPAAAVSVAAEPALISQRAKGLQKTALSLCLRRAAASVARRPAEVRPARAPGS